MENWIVDNANLLSGLAGIVTVLSIVLPPLLRRNAAARESAAAIAAAPPIALSSDEVVRIPSLAAAQRWAGCDRSPAV